MEVALFPKMQLPLIVSLPELVLLVDEAMTRDRVIGVLAAKNTEVTGMHKPGELYDVGTVAVILKMAKTINNRAQILILGLSRFKVEQFIEGKPYLQARIRPFSDQGAKDIEIEALMSNLLRLFGRMVELAPHLPPELSEWVRSIDNPGLMADVLASTVQTGLADRQKVLEAADVKERLREVTRIITRQNEILELENKIQTQVKGDMDKSQREYYLRQQLKAIQAELGEKDEPRVEIEEYRAKVEAKGLPELAKKEALREIDRLSRMHPSSSEYTVSTTYLDWLTSLPWSVTTEDNLDIRKAEKILDDDHYGLEKAKKRILEYLAVRKLKPEFQGAHPLFCRASGHGQDLAGPVHRKGHGPQVRAPVSRRGSGRGGNPGAPEDIRGRAARPDNEGIAGRYQQSGVHAG